MQNVHMLVGDHFIVVIAADEQSPRWWVNCDVSRRAESIVTKVAKELSTSTEHGDWVIVIISYIDNIIAVDT